MFFVTNFGKSDLLFAFCFLLGFSITSDPFLFLLDVVSLVDMAKLYKVSVGFDFECEILSYTFTAVTSQIRV